MGSHWITCRECKHVSAFPHDMMWFDDKGRVHDPNQWRCKNTKCGILFKKAEEKAFEKHMEREREKIKRERGVKEHGKSESCCLEQKQEVSTD